MNNALHKAIKTKMGKSSIKKHFGAAAQKSEMFKAQAAKKKIGGYKTSKGAEQLREYLEK